MKQGIIILAILLALLNIEVHCQNLQQNFVTPPNSAKPWVFWFWMSGYVSKEGITKDLEMMNNVGIGGVLIMEVKHHKLPDGPVKYSSDEWFGMKKYVAEEAGRLGIEVTSHICEGWSATGGPWVTPDKAMKILAFTEQFVESSGKKIKLTLEQPNKSSEFYKDIRVLAFPAKKETFKINDWHIKGLHYKPQHLRVYRLPNDTRTVPADDCIQQKQIIDLTTHMNPDGTLSVKLPKGEWVILRMGYANSPQKNRPATVGGLGFEIDKFDRSAIDLHWNALIEPLIKASDDGKGGKLKGLEIDSYEAVYQNWTKGFETEFKKRCGYNLEPWMPCLAGYVVETLEQSERFLWDFRKVCSDLMTENYFQYIAEKCHNNGMQLMVESYGTGVFDGFEVAKIADLPMGEFWFRRPGAWHEWAVKLASSAAHITGKSIVGAESYTSSGEDAAFHSSPYALKPKGDHYFTEGLNRMIFHASAHQPWNDNVKPGMTMAPHGIQLHRNNTWVPHAKEYFDYLSRCQYMLQQGQFCADFLYVFPQDYPNTSARRDDIQPSIPAGFDYDVTNCKTLESLKVIDGFITTPAGMRYRHLMFPYNRPQSSDDEEQRNQGSNIAYPRNEMHYTPKTLTEIKRLIDAGASILAPKPGLSPSLINYPQCDNLVKQLTNELWTKGKIYPPEHLAELCKKLRPDFESSKSNDIKYIHRKIDDSDIFFVTNRQLTERTITATFRVSGKKPEFWNPETGEISMADNWKTTDDGRTEINIDLSSAGSVFVVFRNKTGDKAYSNIKAKPEVFATINGNWEVTFDPVYGPKEPVTFRYLDEWNNHSNPLIKYFSGTATYKKTFELMDNSQPVYLDLGNVEFMARVKLNGSDFGLLWKPPYQVEITKALKKGENILEVEVTNSWINRLIGDEKLEEIDLSKVPTWISEGRAMPDTIKRKTYITNNYFNANDPLVPSGLIGPVRLKR